MLVVLGLDSLDADRVKSCPTPHIDAVKESGEGGRLNPGEGLSSDELITQVLWPSLLAGRHPKDLFPSYYEGFDSETKYWDNIVLDSRPIRWLESRLAQTLPRTKIEWIKEIMASAGASKSHIGADRLNDHGSILNTADSPYLISVPGINEDAENADLKSMIAPEDHDNDSYQPTVDMTKFERAGLRADADRLIRTLNAIESRGHDFLMTHFFSLDLVQHVWANVTTKIERWYGLYDDFVGRVQHALSPEDTLVLVSDHGMRTTGVHSRQAFYACSKPIWGNDEWLLPDFRSVLEQELREHSVGMDQSKVDQTVDRETREHLEKLGYF